MMQARRTARLITLVAAGISLTGCGEKFPCGNDPEFFADNCPNGAKSMVVGQSLVITIPPGAGIPGFKGGSARCPVASVTWTSSNPAVASIESTSSGEGSAGTVRALSPGATDISALVSWNGGTTGRTTAFFGAEFDQSRARTCRITVTSQ